MQTEIEKFAAKCPSSGQPRIATGGEIFRGIADAAVRAGLVKMKRYYDYQGNAKFGFIKVGA